MSDRVQEFFSELATRRYKPLLHSVSGTIQWNIDGEGRWNVGITKGAVTVNRDAVVPDNLVSCSTDTFLALASGVQNPLTALETRYLPIEDYGIIGDLTTVALVGRDGSIEQKGEKDESHCSISREPASKAY